MKQNLFPSRILLFTAAQMLVLAVMLTGCQKKASDEIDFGTFDQTVYHNKFFGLSATTPAGWNIQDQKEQQRIMKLGEKMIAGDDKSMKAVMSASELQSVSLFIIYKYAMGSPVTNNCGIMAVAERVGQYPGIKRGKDYLFQMRQTLQAGQIQADYADDPQVAHVGGVDFDVGNVVLHVRNTDIREKYYCTIMKGYALSFIIMYQGDRPDPEQQTFLDSVTFK